MVCLFYTNPIAESFWSDYTRVMDGKYFVESSQRHGVYTLFVYLNLFLLPVPSLFRVIQ